MFAPANIGDEFYLSRLSLRPNPEKPVIMKVLPTSPRVFDILNVFTKEEADNLVARALAKTFPSHQLKRSTTGTTQNSIFKYLPGYNCTIYYNILQGDRSLAFTSLLFLQQTHLRNCL
jgi:hypothetical protein